MTTKNKSALRGMNGVWLRLRGYVAAAVTLVACPCHLPLTLPLLLSLTAGTALGVFLQQHPWVVFGVFTVLFVGGLYLTLGWVGQDSCRVDPLMRERRWRRETRTRPTTLPTSVVLFLKRLDPIRERIRRLA